MPTSVIRELPLRSPAFENGQEIPSRFTCDGSDVSPALEWGKLPKGTESLAMILEDPDSPKGTWTHWMWWDVDPATDGLEEGADIEAAGGVVGRNTWERAEYGGPCPGKGRHRYFFRLYALDERLDLPENATRGMLQYAMRGHVVARGELLGTYVRR